MKINQNKWDITLLLLSVYIIGMEHNVFSFTVSSISIPFLTLNELNLNKPNFLNAILLFVLIYSLFLQTKLLKKHIFFAYSTGYKNPTLANYVTESIAKVCGHNSNGAPFGNLKPSLFKKIIRPGRFKTSSGRLTDELSINVPNSIHVNCMVSGIISIVFSRNTFFSSILVLFGLWALIIASI